MYDYLIVTHLPAFYKVNLYNKLAKQCKISVIFIGSETNEKRSSDFITLDKAEFEYTVLSDGYFQKRNKLQSSSMLLKQLRTVKHKKVLISGWDLPEFWLTALLSPARKNCLALESTIHESKTCGIKALIKRFFLSRISTVFASGKLHVDLLKALRYKREVHITKGVGIINKPDFKSVKKSYQKRFVYVGRLSRVKNLEVLIRVFNELPNHQLTLIGTGEDGEFLKSIAQPNIVFPGAIDNSRLGDEFQNHDMFILPSKSEPWGLVVEEALYFGLPVIVSAKCGASELIQDGTNGYVIDPNDRKMILERVLSVDVELYKFLCENISRFNLREKDAAQVNSYLIEGEMSSCNKKTKISLVNFADKRGGAAIATVKFFDIAKSIENNICRLFVAEKRSSLPNIIATVGIVLYMHFVLRIVALAFLKLFTPTTTHKRSLNFFSLPFLERTLKKSDIIHLHWVNNEMLSIGAISRLIRTKKTVITLHDEWFYGLYDHCLEPYTNEAGFAFDQTLKPEGVLNQCFWSYKKRKLSENISGAIITAPSSWIKERAGKSLILKGADIRVVPNPIDTEVFTPSYKRDLYSEQNIDKSKVLFAFGAVDPAKDTMKGASLFIEALEKLDAKVSANIHLIIFGGDAEKLNLPNGLSYSAVGRMNSPSEMAGLLASVDYTVVPSLAESFGQVAAESIACGTPVISFSATGLKDIIIDDISGFTAQPYDTYDFAQAMERAVSMLKDSPTRYESLCKSARKFCINSFSYDIVGGKLEEIYREVSNL